MFENALTPRDVTIHVYRQVGGVFGSAYTLKHVFTSSSGKEKDKCVLRNLCMKAVVTSDSNSLGSSPFKAYYQGK